MATITTKYSIGDTVYHAGTTIETKSHPCPDCLGERYWLGRSPAGTEYKFSCPRCSTNYHSRSDMNLNYPAHVASVRQLTIGLIEHRTKSRFHDDRDLTSYMCEETGVGGGSVYGESTLFLTEEEARHVAEVQASIANSTVEHIVKMYDQTLSLSDYQLESVVMKEAKEYKDHWSDLFRSIRWLFEECNDDTLTAEELREKLDWYKNYDFAKDEAKIKPATELFDELAEYADQKDLLTHLRTFFDGRADAEYFTDSPSPVINDEMRILGTIDELLAKVAK